MREITKAALLLGCIPAAAALGQVQFSVNGATAQNLPSTGVITLGAIQADTTVRIFDATGVDESAPAVVVEGSSAGATVRVQVAAASVTDAFALDPAIPITVGLRDLGGLTFVNPNSPSDTSLRDRAIVAIAIQGDITGNVEAAQVYRVDVFRDSNDTFGGRILGNITAHQANESVLANTQAPSMPFRSISYLRAGHSITGTITALSPGFTQGNAATYADIDRIVVGPAETATGITGDIIAEKGRITSIFSTGPIGTSTDEVKIWAADGIDEVRIAMETTGAAPNPTLDQNLFVNVKSGIAPSLTQTPLGPREDGSLRRLATSGDLNGVVHATNLATSFNENIHSGILVQGDINAPITVDYMQNYADIIGQSINEPIIIGRQLKGAIVAYGTPSTEHPDAGTIVSIRIGLDAPPGPDVFGSGAPQEPYAVVPNSGDPPTPLFNRGMIGLAAFPHSINPADFQDFEPIGVPWFVFGGNDGGTLDSLIRAEASIGNVQVASMSLKHPTGGKFSRPRIEAPEIGVLRVHNAMELGVIWSGRLNFDGSVTDDEIEDNYASIGSLQLGCVGLRADVWLQDCPFATIDNAMDGEIHLNELAAGETVWIGSRLGTFDGRTCDLLEETAFFLTEESPRGLRSLAGEGQAPDRANIYIHQSAGLLGQIIINGTNALTNAGWDGRVIIGADQLPPPSTANLLDPQNTGTSPDIAPYYKRLSADFGGGAVGQSVFHMHFEDCDPPHDSAGVGAGMMSDYFNNTGQVRATFYGPIRRKNTSQTWAQHLKVYGRPFTTETMTEADECAWYDFTTSFDIFGPSTASPVLRRSIRLQPKANVTVHPGVYRLAPVAADSIKCQDVTGNPPVVWGSACVYDTSGEEPVFVQVPSYVFVLSGDCDGDNTLDQFDLDVTSCIACDIADFNDSGAVSVQDIFDFLAAFFANDPDADVNNSGTITVQDIFDFLTAYFGYAGSSC